MIVIATAMRMIVACAATSRLRLCILRRRHRSLLATGLLDDSILYFCVRLTGMRLSPSVNPFAGATIAADQAAFPAGKVAAWLIRRPVHPAFESRASCT